jgi:hypothetical protein
VLAQNGLPIATLDFLKEKRVIISGPVALGMFVPLGGLDSVHRFLVDNTQYVKVKETKGLENGVTGYGDNTGEIAFHVDQWQCTTDFPKVYRQSYTTSTRRSGRS